MVVGLACLLAGMLAGCMEPQRGLSVLPEPPLSTRVQERRPAPRPAPTPPPRPTPKPTPQTIRGKTLIVDAGHGGRDPGAQGLSRLPEKTINLGIAKRLARLLRDRGARVIMTRDNDRFIELDARAAMADRTRTDLFISIHADASSKPWVKGATIYIASNAVTASEKAAYRVVSALESAGVACRGVRRAKFRVLVGHSRPSMLIECGFLTNRTEAKLLNTAAHQEWLAEAIAEGIERYFGG